MALAPELVLLRVQGSVLMWVPELVPELVRVLVRGARPLLGLLRQELLQQGTLRSVLARSVLA